MQVRFFYSPLVSFSVSVRVFRPTLHWYSLCTWRALLKSVSRHSVSGAPHRGDKVYLSACVGARDTGYDGHLEGTSEGSEPTFSKVCPPLSPKRMVIEVSVMSV